MPISFFDHLGLNIVQEHFLLDVELDACLLLLDSHLLFCGVFVPNNLSSLLGATSNVDDVFVLHFVDLPPHLLFLFRCSIWAHLLLKPLDLFVLGDDLGADAEVLPLLVICNLPLQGTFSVLLGVGDVEVLEYN